MRNWPRSRPLRCRCSRVRLWSSRRLPSLPSLPRQRLPPSRSCRSLPRRANRTWVRSRIDPEWPADQLVDPVGQPGQSRKRRGLAEKTAQRQGYNAYIRSADGKNRVFIGPLIERAEADRLRDLLGRQQNLNGFVVRFQPERG